MKRLEDVKDDAEGVRASKEIGRRNEDGGQEEIEVLESVDVFRVNMWCIGLISSLQKHGGIAQGQIPVIWKSAIGLGAFSRVKWKVASCEAIHKIRLDLMCIAYRRPQKNMGMLFGPLSLTLIPMTGAGVPH